MDGEVVVQTNYAGLMECICSLFAAYFIYNVSYPKGIKNTMLFLEKYIFKVDSDEKTPVTVLKLFTDLAVHE